MDEHSTFSSAYAFEGSYPSHASSPVVPSATPEIATPTAPTADQEPNSTPAPFSSTMAASQQTSTHVEGQPFGAERRGLRKRIGSALAGLVALAAKFATALKALLVALPNVKLLTTAGTALVSVVLYSLFWGWEFAAGFVVLLFLHEMGHVIQLRREGIKASAPTFVPFMGAFIASRSLGNNALAEARVGLAGPILGSIAAGAVAAVGKLSGSDMLIALGYVGFLVNLFNLLPVVPLDGGRAMAAMTPWMWFIGLGALLVLLFALPFNPILLIIVLFGGYEVYRRWEARRRGSPAQVAYYRVAPRDRLLVGLVYIGLAVALAFGMSETHILVSSGHSFRL